MPTAPEPGFGPSPNGFIKGAQQEVVEAKRNSWPQQSKRNAHSQPVPLRGMPGPLDEARSSIRPSAVRASRAVSGDRDLQALAVQCGVQLVDLSESATSMVPSAATARRPWIEQAVQIAPQQCSAFDLVTANLCIKSVSVVPRERDGQLRASTRGQFSGDADSRDGL